MIKFSTIVFTTMYFSSAIFAQGPYAPAAGQPKSTAVHKDSAIFKSWASGIEVKRGPVNIGDLTASFNGSNLASFGAPGLALGNAEESAFGVVSLGDGGTATLSFDRPVSNGPGVDFAVFENSFSDTYLELAFIEVSSDGKKFVRFPAISLTQTKEQLGGAPIDPTNIYNLAGKYRLAYGTPFDLDDIKDSIGIDLNNIRFVRVRDVVGSINPAYATYDSKGNVINEPWPSAYHSCGFDLDALGLIHSGQAFSISTFEELTLKKDFFWNGSDKSGGFSSGAAFFNNSYNATYGNWSGFSFSNMRNDSTSGYLNQYSAITKGGISAPDSGGTNYVTAYYSAYDQNNISFKDKAYVVSGLYLTNSAYAFLSMKAGDDFTKKFGGVSGNDPDYFKIQFWGEREDSTFTNPIDFYLADFRFADNAKDYIVNSWQWVDLLELGKIRKIHFNMSSSDNGDWGMNTPSYYCLDNLTILPNDAPILFSPIADVYAHENSENISFPLSLAFTAYETDKLIYSVETNDNPDLVQASIINDAINLSFTSNKTGHAQIVVGAKLGEVLLSDTFNVIVSKPNIIKTTEFVHVYPNPFISQVNIDCTANSQIFVMDLAGHILLDKTATDQKNKLDLSTFPKGVYLLKVVSKENTRITKLLKQ